MSFQLCYTSQTPKIQGTLGIRPNGQAIVGATDNHTIATWDIQTGNRIETLELDPTLLKILVSHNGQTAIAHEQNEYVAIWDIPTQRTLGRFQCSRCSYDAQSLSRDRSKLVGRNNEPGRVITWDVPTGQILHSFEMEPYVTCVAIDPMGRIVVAGSENYSGGDIHIWDIVAGRQLHALHVFDFVPRPYSPYLDGDTDDPKGVVAIWLSPDAQTLLFKLRTNEIQVWDVLRGERLRVLPSHINHIRDFTTDSRFVSTNAGLLDWRTGEITGMRSGLAWMARTMAISQNGRFWITTSQAGTWVVQDLLTKEEITPFSGHSGEISALVLSPDEQTFITSGSDCTAKIWSFATGEVLQTLKTGSHRGLKALALTRSGLPLTLFTAGEEIGVWDGRSGRKVRSLKGEQQSYYSVAISADGQYLASGSFAYGIQIWDWQRGKLLLSFKHSTDSGGKYSEVTALAFSTHHRALMSLDSVGRLRFWNFLTGEQMSSPMAQHSITKMAISPDATLFAAASSQGIQIWDLVTDTKIHTLSPYRDRRNSSVGVRCLAFSPNNRLLASGYYRTPTSAIDSNIKIWDIASGQEQQSLPGHSLTVTGLAFSRNGQTLISCSEDSSVRIWQTINA